jgi:uncharacterized protein YlaI
MSNRCSVCDLLDGFGSELYENYHRNNRVRWRPIAKEYICDECAKSISDTLYEQEYDQTLERWVNHESMFSKNKFTTAIETNDPE